MHPKEHTRHNSNKLAFGRISAAISATARRLARYNPLKHATGPYHAYDRPAGYSIYVSDDKANWGKPVATGTGERWGITTARFATKAGRYIKVEQTGTKNQVWSIFELDVWRMQ